jgi:hypothetical protein
VVGLTDCFASSLVLPAEDGVQGDAEGVGGVLGGPGEKRVEPQDAEAGFGREVGPLAFGELVPARGEDLEGFSEERNVQRLLVELGEAVEDGVARAAVLAQPLCECEPEEVGRFHQGSERQGVERAARHRGLEESVEVGRSHGGSTPLAWSGSRAAG